jgi:TatD DNase family protein
MWFDSHCHLDSHNCPADARSGVLERARGAGVEGFVCIGVGGLDALREAVGYAEREPDVWATAGVHPHDAAGFDAELEAAIREALGRPRVVALGEVGLDYHYDHSPRPRQREVFSRMIALARELGKPLVIHTREAPGETLELLESEAARDVGGIIHCFSEDRAFARRALDSNFDLSFSGIVTFKNALAIRDVAAWAPADRILLETDSPYLAPVPLRGKRCEPAYVVHTAACVATLRGQDLVELARQTTENTRRRFGLV